MKQCSSIADIESEMEQSCGRAGSSQSLHYRNLLRRISRSAACWNRCGKLSFPWPRCFPVPHPFDPPSRGVCSLFAGRVSRGRQFKVHRRTIVLYISIPQLRRRFSAGAWQKGKVRPSATITRAKLLLEKGDWQIRAHR